MVGPRPYQPLPLRGPCIKARPIVNLSYNENVFKVLFGEDTISILESA